MVGTATSAATPASRLVNWFSCRVRSERLTEMAVAIISRLLSIDWLMRCR
jgi:hypothetical protein